MVVTRQGTVTSPAGPEAVPSGATAGAAGAGKAPTGRSPHRAAAKPNAPSAKKRGTPSPAQKGARAKGRMADASPDHSPRAAGGRRAAAPRVQLASKAEVLGDSKVSGQGRETTTERPLYKGGILADRLQTGPLPFVRGMSNMGNSDDESDEEDAEKADAHNKKSNVTPREPSSSSNRRTAAAATSGVTRQSSSRRLVHASSRPEQSERGEATSDFGNQAQNSREIIRSSNDSSNGSSTSSSSRLSEGKLAQLLLTYFCYASLYLTRKPFASCKRELELQLGFTATALGGVDSAFLGAYAASQLLLAPALLGNPRGPTCTTILSVAYAVSACCCFLIYLLPDQHLSLLSILLLWGINGAAQALAFPLTVATLSSWLSSRERGGILGVWTTCQQVGSIFASYLTAELLSAQPANVLAAPFEDFFQGHSNKEAHKWRLAFLVPAIWVFGCAILLGRCLRRAPAGPASVKAGSAQQAEQQQKALFSRVLGFATLRRLCAAYFCVKLVRYSLLYWLPYYLEKQAGLTASAAGVTRGCEIGDLGYTVKNIWDTWLSDRYLRGRRLLLLSPLCCIAGASVALLHYSVLWGPPEDLSLVPQAALLLAGAAIAAPDSVLGGAATADACAEEAGASDEVLAAAASCALQNTGLFPALLQAQPKLRKCRNRQIQA
ncbi:sugar permease, putative [Eimeria necatrix]|uniref:Sugar permease, putative n=1 Tax=Eimeria necatrix TaxID=51315 RepID=U6N9G0_9EIME|nr:sugar permease, putative [Eimeria necatrix]CDJ70496.1 sugar permease, putative [Eimeria necatrix]